MPGFLYYLPTFAQAATLDDVAAVIPGRFETRFLKSEVHGGPDGNRGLLVSDPKRLPAEKLAYLADKQTWLKAPGDGAGWVGWYSAEPPRPRDLLRSQSLDGHLVRLGDGREWLAPVARGIRELHGEPIAYRAVPGGATLGDDGQWTGGAIQPRYRRLWEIATSFAEAFFESDDAAAGIEFDYDDQQSRAVECLAANYAIGAIEVSALGLLDDQLYAAREILKASIDWPTLERWLKKKAAETSASNPVGSNSGNGSPD